MSLLAWRNRLPSAPPSTRGIRLELVAQLVPPAVFLASIPVAYLVFLASIPVAYLVSSPAARLSWLTLVVVNPVVGILVRRRALLV